MHEMGLMDAVLRMVDRVCTEEGVEQVDTIVVEVGELSGVLPHFLRECYEAIIDDTPYEHTRLEIETVPGTLYCSDCGLEFRPNLDDLRCPQCLSRKLTPRSGRDFMLKEIIPVFDEEEEDPDEET